jgi:hypothetical protein
MSVKSAASLDEEDDVDDPEMRWADREPYRRRLSELLASSQEVLGIKALARWSLVPRLLQKLFHGLVDREASRLLARRKLLESAQMLRHDHLRGNEYKQPSHDL